MLCPGQEPDEPTGPLTELRGLLEAAGAEPVGSGIVQRAARAPIRATLMGRGKVEEIAAEVERLRARRRRRRQRPLARADPQPREGLGVRVLDRSELILDIFARRAQTRQARLQVELAQTEYLLPRLRRMWTHLERMEGAIGTRGPGETQLETDRRLIAKRVQDLRARAARDRGAPPARGALALRISFTVGLVGYTNAGKSTLLNRLTGAREFVADMLFATLDTRTRQWRLPDGRTVLLSDTVGFLQRLPHHLVASFHATLEEALNADLLLHVVDASHPDAVGQMRAVQAVLGELSQTPRDEVLVLNKIDRATDSLALDALLEECRDREVVRISARTGAGLERLCTVVARHLDQRSKLVDVVVPLADGRSAAAARRAGALLAEELIGETHLRFRLKLSPGALGVLYRECGAGVSITAAD